jgi:exodeoxyribonuclease VII large subunit
MKPMSRQQLVLGALTSWRDSTARSRGVPDYMVLPNTTINAIAQALPANENELLAVKGIKEGKLRDFGRSILAIVNNEIVPDTEEPSNEDASRGNGPDALSVGTYLDALNRALRMTGAVRVLGEVTQIKEQGNAVYFSLKDQGDGSTISVFMWKSNYVLSGVVIEDGMAIIAGGVSEIYKPSGRLSFRAETVELVGEGALKLAYEKLKKQLTEDGLFLLDRKRPIPELPAKIGLVTSKNGAVIHDFLNNLGKFGMKITFIDSRVEGVAAVGDILDAIATLRKKEIDVLVIIRGGGSLESLQAFNNEHVVRAIAEFPVPVICAIGHHEDVPLAQLAADSAPSTPTACAVALNGGWEDAVSEMNRHGQTMLLRFNERLMRVLRELERRESVLLSALRGLMETVSGIEKRVRLSVERLAVALGRDRITLQNHGRAVQSAYLSLLRDAKKLLSEISRSITAYDPRRLLRSGYAFATRDGKLLRSVSGVNRNDMFRLHVSDGTIDSTVIRTESNKT